MCAVISFDHHIRRCHAGPEPSRVKVSGGAYILTARVVCNDVCCSTTLRDQFSQLRNQSTSERLAHCSC